MADLRRFDLEDLVNRPGTYVNPSTEVVIVVDDSATMDTELLSGDGDEAEWVLVSDEVPLDESQRDDLLERFQRRAQRSFSPAAALDPDEDEDVADEEDDFGAAGFDEPSAYDGDDDL